MDKKFYVTTPIYYATAAPHLGTLYSTVLADVIARFKRLSGFDVMFLTGTDEFGQKVAQAAQLANKKPKEFVDGFIDAYKNLWQNFDISYSCFMRTTSDFHIKAVQKWIMKLQSQGDIYKDSYKGWYCTPCETFLTEKDFEKGQLNPNCVSCSRETNLVSEECYFFKLSYYQEKLLKFYKDNPNFITPKERFAEVIKFVESGLCDISISRSTISWGVPFPGDDKQVAYVWADALNNYITAVGYSQDDRKEEFKKWWPADVQVMGKDIVRFHAIYWPAFLMAAELEMPKMLLVHGWIKVGENKMSKSLGNFIDPKDLLEKYGSDSVRYYLTRQIAINQDGNFNIEDLENRTNCDLANDVGNLLQRMVVLSRKNDITYIDKQGLSEDEEDLKKESYEMILEYQKQIERGFYHNALNALWKFISSTNAYFHNQEPWKIAKNDNLKFKKIIYTTSHSLYIIAVLLSPVMPKKMGELLNAIGIKLSDGDDIISELLTENWTKNFEFKEPVALFEKIEKVENKDLEKTEVLENNNLISIEDFLKIELVAGTIIEADNVLGSDKLLKLTVDFGTKGKRTIFSGVKKHYKPEDLIFKQAIFVFNLKPRKMMGQESQGMMLFAKTDENNLSFILPSNSVENGTILT